MVKIAIQKPPQEILTLGSRIPCLRRGRMQFANHANLNWVIMKQQTSLHRPLSREHGSTTRCTKLRQGRRRLAAHHDTRRWKMEPTPIDLDGIKTRCRGCHVVRDTGHHPHTG